MVNKAGPFELGKISDFLLTRSAGFRQVADMSSGIGALGRFAAQGLAVASCNPRVSVLQAIEHFQRRADLFFAPVKELDDHSQSVFKAVQNIVELVRACEFFEKLVRDKAEQLGSLGWTIPMDASLPEVIRILERSTNAENADAAFAEFYAGDGDAAYVSLKEELLSRPELEPWREELATACARLDDGDYLSCVSILIPVLDGFAASEFCEPGFHKKRPRARVFALKIGARENSLLDEALWRSVESFINYLFEPVGFADESKLSTRLNRHAHVHGRGSYKDKRSDCLRLLQALQTLFLL